MNIYFSLTLAIMGTAIYWLVSTFSKIYNEHCASLEKELPDWKNTCLISGADHACFFQPAVKEGKTQLMFGALLLVCAFLSKHLIKTPETENLLGRRQDFSRP